MMHRKSFPIQITVISPMGEMYVSARCHLCYSLAQRGVFCGGEYVYYIIVYMCTVYVAAESFLILFLYVSFGSHVDIWVLFILQVSSTHISVCHAPSPP